MLPSWVNSDFINTVVVYSVETLNTVRITRVVGVDILRVARVEDLKRHTEDFVIDETIENGKETHKSYQISGHS